MKKTKFAIESEKYAKENPFIEKPIEELRTLPEHLGDLIRDNISKDNIIKALQANITEIMANKAELARENEELRKALREAKELIKHIGWTSSEQTEVIQEADRWLRKNSSIYEIL